MRSIAEADDENEPRAIDREPRGDLPASGLQKAFERPAPVRLQGRQDRKNRAEGKSEINVRRAVERIDRKRERARGIDQDRLGELFGGVGRHRRAARRRKKNVVGENIERRLPVAVRIYPDRHGIAWRKALLDDPPHLTSS